jgi:hypothetical protein
MSADDVPARRRRPVSPAFRERLRRYGASPRLLRSLGDGGSRPSSTGRDAVGPALRGIVAIDADRFGSRPPPARQDLQGLVDEALHQSRVDRTAAVVIDRGEGVLIVLPPGAVPTVAGDFLRALTTGVGVWNRTHDQDLRIRLRVALHAGGVAPDTDESFDEAVDEAARLADAPPLRDTLSTAAGDALALMVSDRVFREAGPPGDPSSFVPMMLDMQGRRVRTWLQVGKFASSMVLGSAGGGINIGPATADNTGGDKATFTNEEPNQGT